MLFLLSLRHLLKLIMIDSLLRFEVIFLKIFHNDLLMLSHHLVHLLHWVTLGRKEESAMPLVFSLLNVLRDLIPKLRMVDL